MREWRREESDEVVRTLTVLGAAVFQVCDAIDLAKEDFDDRRRSYWPVEREVDIHSRERRSENDGQ